MTIGNQFKLGERAVKKVLSKLVGQNFIVRTKQGCYQKVKASTSKAANAQDAQCTKFTEFTPDTSGENHVNEMNQMHDAHCAQADKGEQP